MTTLSIRENRFLIDGRPTHEKRMFEGRPIEGLLFNVRAVQATFDDENPGTRPLWAYPDTRTWDPERNVADFIDALPAWKTHGVLAFTIGFQGGGARYVPEVYDTYDNSAFTRDGDIKPAYASRISRVLAAADRLGMAVVVSLFYWKQTNKMSGEKAVRRAIENACLFIESSQRKNVLLEIANESDYHFDLPLFQKERCHAVIAEYKNRHPQLLISTSFGGVNAENGNGMPTTEVINAADAILIHGNGARPAQLAAAFEAIRANPAYQRNPKPIIINEDSTGIPNLDASWRDHVSWGYYDQGYNGEPRIHDIWVPDQGDHVRENRYEDLSGFQTLPVNWGINTPRKKAFFNRVAEITGSFSVKP